MMVEDYIPVRDVMSREPIIASPRMSLDHAASLMLEKNVKSLIVVKKGVPVGIVTEYDFLTKAIATNKKPSQITLKDIMTNHIYTVPPDTDISEAARMMAKLRIRRLPVVEDSKLVGIVTESDILRISPTLIEITREYAKINSRHDEEKGEIIFGICESCEEYSDELIEVDGSLICKSCKEE